MILDYLSELVGSCRKENNLLATEIFFDIEAEKKHSYSISKKKIIFAGNLSLNMMQTNGIYFALKKLIQTSKMWTILLIKC